MKIINKTEHPYHFIRLKVLGTLLEFKVLGALVEFVVLGTLVEFKNFRSFFRIKF